MTRLPTSMLLCLVPVVLFAGCRIDRDEAPRSGAGTTDSPAASPARQGEATPEGEPKAIFLPPRGGRIYGGAEDGSQDHIVFKLGGGESGSAFEFAANEVLPNNGPPSTSTSRQTKRSMWQMARSV